MKPILLIVSAILAFRACAFADGGTMQWKQTSGLWSVALFSQPAPLRAGPADLSVLLQKNGEPVLDAQVTMQLVCEEKISDTQWRPSCCSMDGGSAQMTLPATAGQAANRLFYSAAPVLPWPGRWKVRVTAVQNQETISAEGELFVQNPPAPWMAYLPWLLIPVAGIGFFALVQAAKNARKR